MALPSPNAQLKFTTKLPSTGKPVSFRPFLASEEKLILVARETEDLTSILGVMTDILKACVLSDIDVESLPMYDVTYLFIQLRAKSVGEQDRLKVACEHCKEANEIDFNYETDVKLTRLNELEDRIKLTDEFSLRVRVPALKQIIGAIEGGVPNDEAQDDNLMLIACIEGVEGAEEYWSFADYTTADRLIFLAGLTMGQKGALREFVNNFPQVAADVSFVCTECGMANNIHLEGPANFFG